MTGYTREELLVIRQGKTSGTKAGVETLLKRVIPEADWLALTKQKIDQLLRWEPSKDAIFLPYKSNKTRK